MRRSSPLSCACSSTCGSCSIRASPGRCRGSRSFARAAFPVLKRLAYLNAGAVGPIASATVDAMQARLCKDAEEGRSGGSIWQELRGLRDRVRGRLAGIVGADPAQVAIVHSTTAGVNTVVAGLRLGADDEV